MQEHAGSVFVVSAPSGTGKSTLCRRLVAETPGLIFSTSFTTRRPRQGEMHGRDYFFVDPGTFDAMIRGNDLLEWVEVYGNRYGTGRAWIDEQLRAGTDVLLDIETTGAQNVHEAMPEAVMIFILPPSSQELERRIRGRLTETDEQISLRLARARHELEQFSNYDYLVVNDDLEEAYARLSAIIRASRCGRERATKDARAILGTFD